MTEPIEILLVEDNPNDIELALHAFAKHKLANRVQVARDGQEALDYLFGADGHEDRVLPKVILLDLDLPKVDGFEVLRQIRADEKLREVPVVILSSSREERDVIASYDLGVNGYIVKPTDFGKFVETMQLRLTLDRPLSVLIVEDSESDAELVALELLRHGFDVDFERVDTGPALKAALEAGSRIVVLCGYDLPSLDPREALRIVRESGDVPFVLLSETIGEEAAADALKAGASDIVVKSNLSRVGTVVDRVLLEAENRRIQEKGDEALRESEARKTSILDSALDAVITIDQEGRIIDFNAAAEAMFGYPREEVAGQRMAELIVPPSLRQQHHEAFAHHLATGEHSIIGTRVELTAMRADGSEFPVELSITRSELSARPFFTGYLRDLTEQKVAEEERANLEAQLRQAQKMEAIGSLAVGITHDFNNLLAVVNGYSEILLRGLDEGDPRRDHVEQILAAGEKANLLTRQLLAFGRQQRLEPKVLDLNGIVAGIEPMLERLIGDSVDLVTSLDSELGRIKADPGHLEQVIMNLVVNARDAMPEGGRLAIETSTAEFDQDSLDRPGSVVIGRRRYARLSVSDTGTGMDDETQARIFEPFFTTKEVGKGTGLGLATVYGIVNQSDGFVSVYSELEHGTTLNVYLPLVEAPLDPQDTPDPERAPARGSETLLLIEDDEALIRLFQVTLEEFGYAVTGVRSGVEAVELCEGDDATFDLAITDIVMPGMGGLDVGRQLMSLKPDMKLLFMSGLGTDLVEAERLELGAGFIQKPFSATSLSRKVRELLDSS